MFDVSLILTYAIKILGIIVGGYLATLVPKIKIFIDAKLTIEQQNKLKDTIKTFVVAADQMYKEDDPNGSIRNQYVKEELTKLGKELNSEVVAMIEEQVSNLGHDK